MIRERDDVRLKANTPSMIKAVAMIVAGVALFSLSISLQPKSREISMGIIVVGGALILTGMFILLSRPKMLVYLPTGSRLDEHFLFFGREDLKALTSIIEEESIIEQSGKLKSKDSGNVRLNILVSRDNKFASVQICEYEGFGFEPTSRAAYFCDESAQAVADFVNKETA